MNGMRHYLGDSAVRSWIHLPLSPLPRGRGWGEGPKQKEPTMTADGTIHALIETASRVARVRQARAEWVTTTCAAWRQAQEEMDDF